MKKLVNSKIVDIKNIDLFELGAEGLAKQNKSTSITSDGLNGELNLPIVKKYIALYDILLKSMTYPLYAVEEDIKYATVANYIKSSTKDKIEIWVDNGLYIRVDKKSGLTVKLVNNTWGICYKKEDTYIDNTDLELYKDDIGYEEYNWLLSKVLNRDKDANFYKEFMSDFLEACNNQKLIFNWEIQNILTFSQVPNKIEIKSNVIYDIENDVEYILDIYNTGEVETGKKENTISLSGKFKINSNSKKLKTYGFDLYKSNKLEKKEIVGIKTMFIQICAIKNSNELTKFPEFKAIIYDEHIIFEVIGKLYICKLRNISEPIEIANNTDLYAIDSGKIYFIKKKRISKGLYKEYIYNYTIRNGDTRLSKIQFGDY